ncbi:MAG: hypothetical protein IPG97_13565 [Microthrixaceae bacterium]|nr:hypothetical protein [Microthrixaceae bacterium]
MVGYYFRRRRRGAGPEPLAAHPHSHRRIHVGNWCVTLRRVGLLWETGSVGAAGVFTVPLNPDGTITLETAGSTNIRVAVTGYWKIPTGTDTGLGLDLLDAPTRLVDTTTNVGVCDSDPCDTAQSNTPVEVAVTDRRG